MKINDEHENSYFFFPTFHFDGIKKSDENKFFMTQNMKSTCHVFGKEKKIVMVLEW